jgi:hypothetical protein
MYFFPPSILPSVESLTFKKKYERWLYPSLVVSFIVSSASAHVFSDRMVQALETVVQRLWPFRTCRENSFVTEIFLTDVPKRFPKKGFVLTEDHINTGYSVPCESLVVYRKQEWFKVFIHETFHYLGLDSALSSEVTLDMFAVSFKVSLMEAYSETWAKLLQCEFLKASVEKERQFSVKNMVRVLRHYNLKYSDLWGIKAGEYREETNVFAYVVLSAILLHDHEEFVRLAPNFKGSNENIIGLIRATYRSPSFLKRVQREELKTSDTGSFRMSVHELIL